MDHAETYFREADAPPARAVARRGRPCPPSAAQSLFRSFFFAGFEGTACFNRHGNWIDQIVATEHDRQVEGDYARLRATGLCAAREAIRWPIVDRSGRYDFSSVQPFVDASRHHRIEVIWDLFHYGYPAGLDPFSDAFPARFADYCHAAARFIRARTAGTCYFTPVNEPSFFAWAGGEVGRFAPHALRRGPELKRALVRAAIAGINAIRAAVPDARIVNVDPVCHVVPPPGGHHAPVDAEDFNERAVFEAWDMIAGRVAPELGGSPDHLDIVGVNYYWTNQWEIGREERPLGLDDPRRLPLSTLLRRVWQRYGRELLLTESAHVGDLRPVWVRSLAAECVQLLDAGVPLRGVCLYPILGMPEWHEPEVWTHMGLWDCVRADGRLQRQLHAPMHEALRAAQREIEPRVAQAPKARPHHVRGHEGRLAASGGEPVACPTDP